MDIRAYIESGIVQDYCVGLLDEREMESVENYAVQFPEIATEIKKWQSALEKYAMNYATPVPFKLKSAVLEVIESLNKEGSFTTGDLPVINRFSDPGKWLKVVRTLLPATLENDTEIRVVHEDDKILQAVIWTKSGYPDEVHDDLSECLMILEGECECYIEDGEIIKLGPGEFFEIPLHKHHDVKVTRGPVLAVVQRLKVA